MKIQDVLNKITVLQTQILRFGIQQLTSSSRPSSPGLGQVIYEQDTAKLKVFTGVEWNPCSAGGALGRAIVTSNQGSITTEVDLTSLTVTFTVGTSRLVRVTFEGFAASTSADDTFEARLKEGTTLLQTGDYLMRPANVSQKVTLSYLVVSPTAGSHTYKMTGLRVAGAGTVTFVANSGAPSFLLVEDIGPA